MHVSTQLARHLREFYFGDNWTWSTLKDHIYDISWQEAVTPVKDFNTIATLLFHMNYYLNVVAGRLENGAAYANHEASFIHPPINNQEDWQNLIRTAMEDAERFAGQIEQIPDNELDTELPYKKGSYYRNIQGVIEHNHYHLGQIVLLKKLLH